MTQTAVTRTTEQVVGDIRARLDGLWKALSKKPAAQEELAEMANDIAVIAGALEMTQQLYASQRGLTEDMKAQRDLAIHELQTARYQWVQRAEAATIRCLAQDIARETDQDAELIERALIYLAGDRDGGYASFGAEFDAGEALGRIGQELSE